MTHTKSRHKKIAIEANYWKQIKEADIDCFVDRLSDSPQGLYSTISRRKEKLKFKLMSSNPAKAQIDGRIKVREREYEELVKDMIAKNRKIYFESNLPFIQYIAQNQMTSEVNAFS